VTGEPKSLTDKWVESKGAAYAYAFDQDRALSAYFGVRGIPDAVLIDPGGTVVWRGHPASLTEAELRKHLSGALKTPVWAWPSSAKAARTALQKGQLAKALEAAQKVPDQDGRADIEAGIRGIVAARVGRMRAALKEGDYLGAHRLAEELKKSLEGLEQAAEADEVLAQVAEAPGAAEVMKAQVQIDKIRAKNPTKKADIERAIEDLREIIGKNPSTYAGRDAERLIELLKRRQNP
jgi:thioredoxin-like negative regulator of GroEL